MTDFIKVVQNRIETSFYSLETVNQLIGDINNIKKSYGSDHRFISTLTKIYESI